MNSENNTDYFITIKKQLLKDYFLNMSSNRLLDYINYKLKTGIKWRLEYLNKKKILKDKDVLSYYPILIKNIVVELKDNNLI